jgi:hypothetical protein
MLHHILNELSAGNMLQNIAFYSLLVLLIWVVAVQFKQHPGKFRIR